MRRKKFGTISQIQSVGEDESMSTPDAANKDLANDVSASSHAKTATISQIQSVGEDGSITTPDAANKMNAGSSSQKQDLANDGSASSEANDSKLTKRIRQPKSLEEANIIRKIIPVPNERNVPNKDKSTVDAVVVNISNAQGFNPKEVGLGTFFSIHSTAKQPIQRFHEMETFERNPCRCCAHSVAASWCAHSVANSTERWDPYKPGDLL